MTTHVGKIGRLPKSTRDCLGHWIEDGKPGKEIVQKLNAMACVQDLCQTAFGGRPISEQNLSEWKQGGHLAWLRREEMRRTVEDLSEQSDELADAADGQDLSDRLGTIVAAELTRLGLALLEAEPDLEKRWQRLCAIRRELSELRRDDHRATRVTIQREQWERELEREAEAAVEREKQKRRDRLTDKLMIQTSDPSIRRFIEILHRIQYDLPLSDLPPAKPAETSQTEPASKIPSKNKKIQPNKT